MVVVASARAARAQGSPPQVREDLGGGRPAGEAAWGACAPSGGSWTSPPLTSPQRRAFCYFQFPF
jgi:hypothetical protein